MMKQFASMALVTLLLLVVATPARAATKIVGNGSKSDNKVVTIGANVQTVQQSNAAVVINSVVTASNTGGNTAKGNTGDEVGIGTGNAKTLITITNSLNNNEAKLVGCGCEDKESEVVIKENGTKSDNAVVVVEVDKQEVEQVNEAAVENGVGAVSNSGDNTAKNNTGSGSSVLVMTGMTKTMINLMTAANYNWTLVK